MIRKQIDEAVVADRAKGMTVSELVYSRMDAAKTAEAFDAIDRAHGTDTADYYRDEAAIYARELAAR